MDALGDTCDERTRCINGGICVETVRAAVCYCPPGYTGVLCQQEDNAPTKLQSLDQTTENSVLGSEFLMPLLIVIGGLLVIILIVALVRVKSKKDEALPVPQDVHTPASDATYIDMTDTIRRNNDVIIYSAGGMLGMEGVLGPGVEGVGGLGSRARAGSVVRGMNPTYSEYPPGLQGLQGVHSGVQGLQGLQGLQGVHSGVQGGQGGMLPPATLPRDIPQPARGYSTSGYAGSVYSDSSRSSHERSVGERSAGERSLGARTGSGGSCSLPPRPHVLLIDEAVTHPERFDNQYIPMGSTGPESPVTPLTPLTPLTPDSTRGLLTGYYGNHSSASECGEVYQNSS